MKQRSVNTHFWQDNYILDLDPKEKLLFLYLLTNEHTNMLGIYEVHKRKIMFDTGLSSSEIDSAFGKFSSDFKADYVDGYVILVNFIKHQKYNPNMMKSARSDWENLPSSVKTAPLSEPIAKGLEGFGKGSEPIAEIEYELEREIEEETKKEKELNKQKRLDDFEVFWFKYDKKVDKQDAMKRFLKLPQKDVDRILSVVDDYVKQNPDRQYRKNPSTFINKKSYLDKITPTNNLSDLGIQPDPRLRRYQ